MKSNNSNIYRNTARPLSSDKQLLFEEEQKKRAANRNAALGNMQRTGTTASKQSVAGSSTKAQSANSSGSGNSGGIIQTKQNAFSPTAAAQRTGMTSSIYKPQSSTRTGMGGAGAVKSTAVQSGQRSHTAAGGYNAGRRQQEQGGNITRLTRNEAWNMLGEESKRKQSFRFPQDLSEDGGNVLMQLMELPDWGLDHEKKNEKVVELKRSVPNTSAAVKKEAPLRVTTEYGNLGTEEKQKPNDADEQPSLNDELLNNENRYLKGLSTLASEQLLTPKKLLFTAVNYLLNKQKDYSGTLITDQTDFEGSGMRFGFDTMANVGCEVISVYNLLTNAGYDVTLSEVALRFELNGAQMLGGFLGSNPYYCGRVLDSYDIPYTEYYSAQQLEQDAEPGDVIIMSHSWVESDGLPRFHTYFVKCTAYKTVPYYAYNRKYWDKPTRHSSIEDVLGEDKQYLVGYLIKGA